MNIIYSHCGTYKIDLTSNGQVIFHVVGDSGNITTVKREVSEDLKTKLFRVELLLNGTFDPNCKTATKLIN